MSLREQTLDVRGGEAQVGALTLSNKDNGRESAGWRDVGGRRIPPPRLKQPWEEEEGCRVS